MIASCNFGWRKTLFNRNIFHPGLVQPLAFCLLRSQPLYNKANNLLKTGNSINCYCLSTITAISLTKKPQLSALVVTLGQRFCKKKFDVLVFSERRYGGYAAYDGGYAANAGQRNKRSLNLRADQVASLEHCCCDFHHMIL